MAAADAAVKSTLQRLHIALGVYPPGSKKYKGLLTAIKAIATNFGDEENESLIPAAVMQAARKPGGGQPQLPSIPPGIASGAANPGTMPQLPQGMG
jgi:hypothetical protein